jgi:rhamnosyltransferase subunit B
MTVLLVALGSAGDVHPNVGLALALKRRGHRVVLVTSKVFAPLAQRAGIEMHGLGTEQEFYDALRDPDIWHPYRAFSVVARRLILPMMREVYQIIESSSGSGDTVVAAPATAFGARIAHEKLGVPLVSVHLQPTMLRSVYGPPVFGFPDILGHLPRSLRRVYLRAVDRHVIDPLLAPEVNAFRAELGLPPVRRFFEGWVHSPQLVLGLFPSWFAVPQPDWPPHVHLTGFPLYDESDWRPPADGLIEFLEAGDPPIVFTAGSAHAFSAEFFRVSVEACRAGGWRGILLTQFHEQLPARLPDHVRSFDYLPFSTVLPRAAALVHHGGIGTTAQALAAGVPQMVVPFAHDQPDNAVRVHRLGVGDFLLPRRYQARAVVQNLKRLTGSATIGENCRRRARDLAENAPLDKACVLIERDSGRNIMYDF